MRKTVIHMLLVALAGIAAFTGCKSPDNKNTTTVQSSAPVSNGTSGGTRIAHVNIDSLEANYELLKAKRAAFKEKQEQMESELDRSYMQMQSFAEDMQKKAQAKNLSQEEYENGQKRLVQMDQSLKTRRQKQTEELLKEQEDFNKELRTRLDSFLTEYNKTKHFDYILSYSASGSAVLYANRELDITKEVVDGMNAISKNDAKKK